MKHLSILLIFSLLLLLCACQTVGTDSSGNSTGETTTAPASDNTVPTRPAILTYPDVPVYDVYDLFQPSAHFEQIIQSNGIDISQLNEAYLYCINRLTGQVTPILSFSGYVYAEKRVTLSPWTFNGKYIYYRTDAEPHKLYRTDYEGTAHTLVYEGTEGETILFAPLENDYSLEYVAIQDQNVIKILDTQSGETVYVHEDPGLLYLQSYACYGMEEGHVLVYAAEGGLTAIYSITTGQTRYVN